MVCWRIENLTCRRVWRIEVPAQETRAMVSIPAVCGRRGQANGSVCLLFVVNSVRYYTYQRVSRWTAVARGAVIHGIQSLVDSRKLKEHYGVIMGAPFFPELYDAQTAYWDPFFSCLMTNDHVEWFASKVSAVVVVGNPFPVGLG